MSDPGGTEAHVRFPENGELIEGRYRVGALIGAGGMSIVRAASHASLGSDLAMKFMLPADASGSDSAQQSLHEARAAVRLASDHVARVFDVGRLHNGTPYIVMERLRGRDLANLLRERKHLPVDEAVSYVLQAMHAIAEAHLLGIVHRDIKPRNLFLARRADGRPLVKVLDFGIAKAGDAVGRTQRAFSPHTFGSPAYMSPEQLRGSPEVDCRTDIWSLGVVLYELTGGAAPFAGSTLTELAVAVHEEPHIPLDLRCPDVPPGFARVVDRCLSKRPEQRYASVLELARALVPFAQPNDRPLADDIERLLAARASDLDEAPPASSVRSSYDETMPAAVPGVLPTVGHARRSRVLIAVAILLTAAGAAALITRLWQTPTTSDDRASARSASGVAVPTTSGVAVQERAPTRAQPTAAVSSTREPARLPNPVTRSPLPRAPTGPSAQRAPAQSDPYQDRK